MTRERVVYELENSIKLGISISREACEWLLDYLEQEPVINKIRAEIKTKYNSIPWRNNDYDDGWIEALEWIFDDVIDKYKTEQDNT